jgi:hypothetical protein
MFLDVLSKTTKAPLSIDDIASQIRTGHLSSTNQIGYRLKTALEMMMMFNFLPAVRKLTIFVSTTHRCEAWAPNLRKEGANVCEQGAREITLAMRKRGTEGWRKNCFIKSSAICIVHQILLG